MKAPLIYYNSKFIDGYVKIKNAGNYNVISIASFSPDKYISNDGQATIFQNLCSKHLFLFCHFFLVLFDQAMHSALNEEHPYFERITNYPKLCGILQTANVNFHPGSLILMATLYIDQDVKMEAKSQFEILTDFFLSDYENFMLHKYPDATGRLKYFNDRKKALLKLLYEIKVAVNISGRYEKAGIQPFTSYTPDFDFYSKAMDIFSTKLDHKIVEIKGLHT